MNRGAVLNKLVHIINIDIKDNHEDSLIGGKAILNLTNLLLNSDDMDTKIVEVLAEWQEKYPKLPATYAAAYF